MEAKSEKSPPPLFFVPSISPEDAEDAYEFLAVKCGARPMPLSERIYSMEFRNSSESFKATVGEELKCIKIRHGRERAVSVPGVLVLAFYKGHDTYFIAIRRTHAGWNDPILTGKTASRFVLFSLPQDAGARK